MVFDKTGTLTKGLFSINRFEANGLRDDEFKRIVFSLEKYSNHPIAKAITQHWKTNDAIGWKKIEEIKGVGMIGQDAMGNQYELGIRPAYSKATEAAHTAYLLKNGEPAGWLDMEDEVRMEAKEVVAYLHSKNIRTILLSGDSLERCQKLADTLGIKEVYAQQQPADKLKMIEQFTHQGPTAMVGDGINDAPALAKATIGISMSDASQLAMQSAQVVLMNKGIQHLPLALGLGKHTFITIQQNLFWAFIYNIVAIPVAAVGLLHPGIAALAMGFSDVVLAINSVRLTFKKVL